MNKRSMLILLLQLIVLVPQAQSVQPVTWYANAVVISDDEAVINISASIQYPWHIYSTKMQDGNGPVPTRIRFTASPDYKPMGKMKEVTEPTEKMDITFGVPVLWLEDTAAFTQHIKLNGNAVKVTVTVTYMACSDDMCLLPQDKVLTVDIKKK